MNRDIVEREIQVNMLRKYAKNISKDWQNIFGNKKMALKITIFLLSTVDVGAIEFELTNQGCNKDNYNVKELSPIIVAKYNIKRIPGRSIYFGKNSFLIMKPLRYRNWTKIQSKFDNMKLINGLLKAG